MCGIPVTAACVASACLNPCALVSLGNDSPAVSELSFESMMSACCAALSHEDNDRRPGRYILLQEQEKRVYGAHKVKSSLLKGYEFKQTLGHNKWEDVYPQGAMGPPACSPGLPVT